MQWLIDSFAYLIALLIAVLPVHSFVYHAGPLAVPERATIVFGGDMMFDRTIRAAMEREGDDYVLSCLDPLFEGADIVVANLEGPITSNPSKSLGSTVGTPENFTFTFPLSTASLLYRHNIRLVSIGNNHILNFGRAGLLETKAALTAAGVAYMGDPDAPEAERVARLEIGGLPFSFVVWSDWTSDKTDHTVAQVRAEAEAGRITVVYAHWGEEYLEPPERVKALAAQFAEAGASLVVGSHPHIVQERGTIGNTPVYYSIGNMVFDQYWNERVRTGLLLRATFSAKGLESIAEVPIELLRDRRTCPKESV